MEFKFELEEIEDILFDTLHPIVVIDHPVPDSEIDRLAELLNSEKESFPKKIRHTMGRVLEERIKSAYIQLQQSGITRMMDALSLYLLPKDAGNIQDKKKPTTVEELYKKMYSVLESMLQLLRKNYSKEFDLEVKLPDGQKWEFEQGIRNSLLEIRTSLKKKLSVEFVELICEPFLKFLLPETRYSYREFSYLHELELNLLATIRKLPANIEGKISELLLSLNFNSVLFFNYYTKKIAEEASTKKTVNERVEYLSWQIKIINQTALRPAAIYLPDMLPIADQLLFWISEDLYFLQKKHQLSLALPIAREVENARQKKVHVQLTVADLALGARLLLDTEVISEMNYTELMKLVAKNFRTNRQANISQQAIYNIGFEASVTSKEKMKMVLMKMVRRIGEY